ncbi:MAG TPA: hypothetical protein VJ728_16365, partial [Candidatus Binataceae bacterium]|nr:hypothetical protein [Candidatus Binataceae bacterium]
CQDNEINWLDWEKIDEAGHELSGFLRKIAMLRRALPILRRGRFLTAERNEELEVKDVTWINASGAEMADSDWHDSNMRCFGMLIDGRAQTSGIKRPASDVTLLLVLNAHHDVVNFTLPEFVGGRNWLCLIDTNKPAVDEAERFKTGDHYQVTGRSLLLFAALTGSEMVRAVQRIAFELSRHEPHFAASAESPR